MFRERSKTSPQCSPVSSQTLRPRSNHSRASPVSSPIPSCTHQTVFKPPVRGAGIAQIRDLLEKSCRKSHPPSSTALSRSVPTVSTKSTPIKKSTVAINPTRKSPKKSGDEERMERMARSTLRESVFATWVR